MNADVLLDWIGQIRAERRMLRLIINKLLLRRKRKLRKIDTASEPFGVKRISPGQDRAHFLESNHSAHPAPILQDLTRHSVARCNLPAVLAYFPEEACLKQSGLITLAVLLIALPVYSQSSSDTGEAASPPAELSSPAPTASTPITKVEPGHPDKRLFGVVPNYRTVDAAIPFQPLTPRQKLTIASHDSFDWPTYALAGLMTFAMPGEQEAKRYGTGWSGFANRYVRTSADQIIGNMLSEGFLPVLLRQDPRYFRPGIGTFWSRLRSAVSQIAVARNDSGHRTFNTSEFLGNAMTVAVSNTYSPNLRSWYDSSEKLALMVGTDMFSNVIKEFGPDIRRRLPRRHQHGT